RIRAFEAEGGPERAAGPGAPGEQQLDAVVAAVERPDRCAMGLPRHPDRFVELDVGALAFGRARSESPAGMKYFPGRGVLDDPVVAGVGNPAVAVRVHSGPRRMAQ